MRRSDYVAHRIGVRTRQRGGTATLRHVTSSGGPQAAMNPPRVVSAVVNGAFAGGATSMSLRATTAVGRLLAGDRILVGPQTILVTGTALAVANVWTAIPVQALLVGLSDGQAATFSWAADETVAAEGMQLDQRWFPGTEISGSDSQVLVPAQGLSQPPRLGDLLIWAGADHKVLGVASKLVQGQVVQWVLLLRK
jgi:hypothetical protein